MIISSALAVAIIVLYMAKRAFSAVGMDSHAESVSMIMRRLKHVVLRAVKIKRNKDGPRHNDVSGNDKE